MSTLSKDVPHLMTKESEERRVLLLVFPTEVTNVPRSRHARGDCDSFPSAHGHPSGRYARPLSSSAMPSFMLLRHAEGDLPLFGQSLRVAPGESRLGSGQVRPVVEIVPPSLRDDARQDPRGRARDPLPQMKGFDPAALSGRSVK